MAYSFNFCSVAPNIWRAQTKMVSIGENEKKGTERRIAHWYIVGHIFNK